MTQFHIQLLGVFVAAALQLQGQQAAVKVRIGVALPEANGNAGEAVRGELVKYLSGPAVETLPISARLGLQIEGEANAKECNYVLYSTVTQKAGAASGKKGFLHGATSMAGMAPMLGAARGIGGAMAATAASSAMNGVAAVTSTVKAKDEWNLSYRLMPAGGGAAAPIVESSATAQAKANGEDVISPLVRQAAEAVLSKVMAK